MKKQLLTLLLSCSLSIGTAQDTIQTTALNELLASIDSIMKANNTPAMGITIVQGDSTLLATSLGFRDLETKEIANAQTLYRIGSISKMFVALAVLKLQEEGKISLKDRLMDLAPEIGYENPWEETNPILIEHLLEHTTGWDDIHLVEYAHNVDPPTSLKEGLDYHPHSRKSRWVPGTRFSYCNSGPPVAAYIVEKITGQPFEVYVQENFFDPIGMQTATYFKNEDYENNGVTLYNGTTPQDYWHIIMRPSGSINASPLDMAQMLKFFINDATVDSVSLISSASLQRMETPMTTIGARAGLEEGYGLHNYMTTFNGFPFQGHNGGVNGGSSDFTYNRELRVGFALMINSANSTARQEAAKLIATYLTEGKKKPVINEPIMATSEFDGYYYRINPRQQYGYFLTRLVGVKKIWSDDSLVYVRDFAAGKPDTFRATESTMAYGDQGKKSLVITNDPLNGQVVSTGFIVYAPTTQFMIWVSLILAGSWFIGLAIGAIWFMINLVKLLLKKTNMNEYKWMQLSPFLVGIGLLMAAVSMIIGSQDPFENFGKPTVASLNIYLGTWLIGIGSWASIVVTVYYFSRIKRNFMYWFFTALSICCLIGSWYFWSHDLIGFKIWE